MKNLIPIAPYCRVLQITCATLLFLSCNLFAASSQVKSRLTDFRHNVHSQYGEDGIIQKIFQTIDTSSKICIEFGAWDGFYLSNTANLWSKDSSWKGILIECDAPRYNVLVKNTQNFNCIPLHRKVESDGRNTLENILREHSISAQIDLLSIDIDSDDYYIFESLTTLRPRVIICEFNPTMPAHLDIFPPKNTYLGCSVAALKRIATNKGYSLVAITDCNCFFVVNEEFHKFAQFDTDFSSLRIDRYLRYVITDYSGNYAVVAGNDFIEPYGLNAPLPHEINGAVKRQELIKLG